VERKDCGNRLVFFATRFTNDPACWDVRSESRLSYPPNQRLELLSGTLFAEPRILISDPWEQPRLDSAFVAALNSHEWFLSIANLVAERPPDPFFSAFATAITNA
jgi:hypothetical protein